MKKMTTIAIVSMMAIAFFASCGGGSTVEHGVEINGIRWATRNVDTPGTFVRNPENAGGLFTWEQAQYACPEGWRMPTDAELETLVNTINEWTAMNRAYGRTFGTAPNQLFLPAAGSRSITNGAILNAGAVGNYWAGVARGAGSAWSMHITGTNSNMGSDARARYFSVRCVAE